MMTDSVLSWAILTIVAYWFGIRFLIHVSKEDSTISDDM